MKKVIWEGTSWKDLNAFPKPAKRRAGYELFNIQSGENPSDWKPMKSIGKGVKEIRIHLDNEYGPVGRPARYTSSSLAAPS